MAKLTKKHFINAAEYMEKNGFCKGSLGTDDGEVCSLGAVYFGNDRLRKYEGVYGAFAQTFSEPGFASDVVSFNDRADTTKDDAVTLLLLLGEMLPTLK